MQWSHYSEAIFDMFTSTQDNIIVQACPGAGKTTNVKHLWTLDNKPTVYLVFSKHNQVEAEGKMPKKQSSDVLTLNGFGHRAVMNTFGRVQLDDRKVINIVRRTFTPKWKRSRLPYGDIRDMEWMLVKATGVAKQIDTGKGFDEQTYNSMLDTYELEAYEGMHEDIADVLAISDDMTNIIDFNDQIRLPALYRCNMPEYHTVLGDESQDFSPIQAMMVSHIGAQRYVFVGDKRQSIFGFRGAMSNSMDYLKQQFSCVELPLSITYRCAKSIVQHARSVYTDIEPWEESPDGVVIGAAGSAAQYDKVYDTNTLVVCRINAPLITLAYSLLQQDIPCHVRGRNIGEGLIKLVQKCNSESVRHLVSDIQDWYTVEMQKAVAQENDGKMQKIEDKYKSVMLFIDRCKLYDPPDVVVEQIDKVFSQGKGVCLSTVHKAKGLEAERCYMLEYGLHDVFTTRAKRQWQKEQERNVLYVGITRAKSELVLM